MRLYREVHGGPDLDTTPLLLIHGGGSTIETNFGALLPLLTQTRQIVAVELQGHGRTPSIDRPYNFENSADDVAEVITELSVGPIDVLGFSNGGNVALRLVIQHPGLVRRQVVASAFYRRSGMADGFFEQLDNATRRTCRSCTATLTLRSIQTQPTRSSSSHWTPHSCVRWKT